MLHVSHLNGSDPSGESDKAGTAGRAGKDSCDGFCEEALERDGEKAQESGEQEYHYGFDCESDVTYCQP